MGGHTVTLDADAATIDPPGAHREKPDLARLAWDPVDLERVLSGGRVTPEPTLLARVDGVRLLYPGRVHLMMGEPESFKTWLALFAVKQELARGHHVVFLDYEDVAEMAVERLLSMGATPAQILAHFTYYESPPRLDELGEDLVRARLDDRGPPALVILDGVTEVMGSLGLSPEKDVEVTRFYNGVPRWFARTGAAVALLDHVVKNETARGRWATGSQHKLSGLTGAAFSLEVVNAFGRERTGLAKVTISKDRPGHLRRHAGSGGAIAMFELESHPDGTVTAGLEVPMPASGPGQPFRPTSIMERISVALEAATGPLNTNMVRKVVKARNETLSAALDLLVTDGYISAQDGPRNSTVYHSLRPFRADEES